MWKQQDSLEGPLPSSKERRPDSPEAISSGHDEDYDETKPKPMLERLWALEVSSGTGGSIFPLLPLSILSYGYFIVLITNIHFLL